PFPYQQISRKGLKAASLGLRPLSQYLGGLFGRSQLPIDSQSRSRLLRACRRGEPIGRSGPDLSDAPRPSVWCRKAVRRVSEIPSTVDCGLSTLDSIN